MGVIKQTKLAINTCTEVQCGKRRKIKQYECYTDQIRAYILNSASNGLLFMSKLLKVTWKELQSQFSITQGDNIYAVLEQFHYITFLVIVLNFSTLTPGCFCRTKLAEWDFYQQDICKTNVMKRVQQRLLLRYHLVNCDLAIVMYINKTQ